MSEGWVGPIREFFERKDAITPSGGRKVTATELRALTESDREELAALARIELGQ